MENNFKEINYWLNKYIEYLEDDIVGKVYRLYRDVEISELKFLIFVKDKFFWQIYIPSLEQTNSKLDSKLCEYIGDTIVNFWIIAGNFNVLSSEDLDKNKNKINWTGIKRHLNESEKIKYSEELKCKHKRWNNY